MRQKLWMLTVAASLLPVGAMLPLAGTAFAQQAPAPAQSAAAAPAADMVFSRAELEELLQERLALLHEMRGEEQLRRSA